MTNKKELNFKQYVEVFIKFLEKHNVKKEYLLNVRDSIKHDRNSSIYDNINPLTIRPIMKNIELSRGLQIIDYSFTWSYTKEGHEFWSRLNHEWQTFILSNNICYEKQRNYF